MMRSLLDFWRNASGYYVREAERDLGRNIGDSLRYWPVDVEQHEDGWCVVVRYEVIGDKHVRIGGMGSLHRIAMEATR